MDLCLIAALLIFGSGFVQSSEIASRQTVSKFCNAEFNNICYAQFTPSNIIFRVAIPDAAAAPFDTLLQIVAPASVGWAGIAWGGSMTNNPLTIAWPNSNGATVSSRWATGHTVPQAYAGASYRTLGSSKNETHWTADILCSGCSNWSSTSLNPSAANGLAWAMSPAAVAQPASNTSSFGYHQAKGRFSVDLSTARIAKNDFLRYVMYLSDDGTETEPVASPPVFSSPVPSPTAAQPSRSGGNPTITYSAVPSPTDDDGWELEPVTSKVIITMNPAPTAEPDGEDWDDSGDETVTVTVAPTGGALPPAKGKRKGKVVPPFRRPPFKGKGRRPPFRHP